MPSLTRAQVRELDRRAIEEFGVPGVVLMENAGRGAADVLLRLGMTGPVHIVCGKGNNGGDGYVIARHLNLHNIPVTVHRCCDDAELTSDALIHYRILERSNLAIIPFTTPEALAVHLRDAEWVVDALLGTGLAGPLRPPADAIIRQINHSRAKVLAVDLPSGMDADTGQSLGEVVRADYTVTFVAPKQGFAAIEARQWLGQVHVCQIGAPRVLLDAFGVTSTATPTGN